jgi:hypothetical protein
MELPMNRFLTIIAATFLLSINVNSQTINGGFSTNLNGSVYEVTIYLNMATGTGTAGLVNLDFTFNNSAITFAGSPINGTDYIILNGFTSYPTKNITRPQSNKIVIGLATLGTPAPINLNSTPLNIITLYFTIANAAMTSNLTWGTIEVIPSFGGTPYTVGTWNDLNQPLPVELSSFTASGNQNAVNLKWQTATELNNYGFEIERQAYNSTLPDVSGWEKIGFVTGSGNSNAPKDYAFVDKNPLGSSKFKYRLKQIDNDGQYEYSDAVEVMLIPVEYTLYQNYPNPFNPSTKIKFALPEAGKVVLKIYDMTGAEVAELVNTDYEAGYYEIELNASNLASGVYLYRLQSNGFSQVKKLMLLK